MRSPRLLENQHHANLPLIAVPITNECGDRILSLGEDVPGLYHRDEGGAHSTGRVERFTCQEKTPTAQSEFLFQGASEMHLQPTA